MTKQATHPFDDIRKLAQGLPTGDMDVGEQVTAKLAQSLSGLQPLGQLSAAIAWLARWQGTSTPAINKPLVSVFIGCHQVAGHVLDTDVVEGGKVRMASMAKGSAGVRGIAGSVSALFKVFDMGIEAPAADMRTAPSLSERDCAGAIAYGMEVVAENCDIIVLGNAGFGSATAAAGIARGLFGGAAGYWAGGDGETAARRIEAVEQAALTHKEILSDPLEVLRCFGGRDIAGMVGAILAARHQGIPVLLDGFTVCAAAAIVHALNPDALDHCLAAHKTTEPAHSALLERIDKKPLLNFGLGIGDGSGAALTIAVLRAAAAGCKTL
ncbi:MAG: nicotinate-nucleotide--dimethylbenzimidazole phosphoribosyltransferase [Robiginitomaculum sp.]|nr:MAG: nicotinate-nucleotide--dimethylbenzimidazole phosphoribosyltransferase [Robiginitomaculum sp.]